MQKPIQSRVFGAPVIWPGMPTPEWSRTGRRRALAERFSLLRWAATGFDRKFDSRFGRSEDEEMTSKSSSWEPRDVVVRELPIELCQFIKFAGVAESGGAAKQLVAEGGVSVNGILETRKRKQLASGDRVTVAGQTIVVRVA